MILYEVTCQDAVGHRATLTVGAETDEKACDTVLKALNSWRAIRALPARSLSAVPDAELGRGRNRLWVESLGEGEAETPPEVATPADAESSRPSSADLSAVGDGEACSSRPPVPSGEDLSSPSRAAEPPPPPPAEIRGKPHPPRRESGPRIIHEAGPRDWIDPRARATTAVGAAMLAAAAREERPAA